MRVRSLPVFAVNLTSARIMAFSARGRLSRSGCSRYRLAQSQTPAAVSLIRTSRGNGDIANPHSHGHCESILRNLRKGLRACFHIGNECSRRDARLKAAVRSRAGTKSGNCTAPTSSSLRACDAPLGLNASGRNTGSKRSLGQRDEAPSV